MGEYMAIIAENLKSICRMKGIKQVQLAELLGVSQGAVSNWFKGLNAIDVENLVVICDYVGVTFDQVIGRSPLSQNDLLSPEESDLIACYRSVNQDGRSVILGTARAVAGNPEMKKDGSAVTA